MADEPRRHIFPNRWAGALGPGPETLRGCQDLCTCLGTLPPVRSKHPVRKVSFHADRQDVTSPGWQHLLELIDEAAADGRETFTPLAELSPAEQRQIITLPATIGRLTRVRHLVLYGTNMVRIPPEIGAMTSLEEFSPYWSHRLHWFPYELTRCTKLTRSTVSTRSLYGNRKLRPAFPWLLQRRADTDLTDLDPGVWGASSISSCSVCDQPIGATGVQQVWISLRIATDVLPLLVNACSAACVSALPAAPDDYVPAAHRGGPEVIQPPLHGGSLVPGRRAGPAAGRSAPAREATRRGPTGHAGRRPGLRGRRPAHPAGSCPSRASGFVRRRCRAGKCGRSLSSRM
jgi:hypothetical protein